MCYHTIFIFALVLLSLQVAAALGAGAPHSSGGNVMSAAAVASNTPFQLPAWFQSIKSSPRASMLDVREWVDEEWRGREGGWQGLDYVHSASAPCRIVEYCLLQPETEALVGEDGAVIPTSLRYPTLSGVCHFTPRSESHRGFCHGGSLCALMDDCVGWLGFCHTGRCIPWSGYTVQIDTSLKKAIPVGSTLLIEGEVESVERRKVWVRCRLVDPLSGITHGECRGLFLLNKAEEAN